MANTLQNKKDCDPRRRRRGASRARGTPREAVQQAGGQTEVLSVQTGEIQARDHDLDPAGTFSVDKAVGDASVDEFDALLLPGGTVNPRQAADR